MLRILKTFLKLNFLFGLLFIFHDEAKACTCGNMPTTLEAYEESDHVAILSTVSFEYASREEQDYQLYQNAIKSIKMRVEKVYKGNLKDGEELTFSQGRGSDCLWVFDEKSIGNKSLLYFDNPREDQFWDAHSCGRSRNLEAAIHDINFLENIGKLRGKTRISGYIGYCFFSACKDEPIRNLKIIGPGRKATILKTEKDGFFEIYGLPAGKYFIEPEMPFGYVIDDSLMKYLNGFSLIPYRPMEIPGRRIEIDIEEGEHKEVSLGIKIENEINGKLTTPKGLPLGGVCIKALKRMDISYDKGICSYTNPDGAFQIKGLESGRYILVISDYFPDKPGEKKRPIFYPGTYQRSKAIEFNLSPGKKINIRTFWSPSEFAIPEKITFNGIATYADGSPVKNEKIHFIPSGGEEDPKKPMIAYTDRNGKFSMEYSKNRTGRIRAEIRMGASLLKHCPQLKKSLPWSKEKPEGMIDLFSPWKRIRIKGKMKRVRISFPFPKCAAY